jgi:hypothetical protein
MAERIDKLQSITLSMDRDNAAEKYKEALRLLAAAPEPDRAELMMMESINMSWNAMFGDKPFPKLR